MVIQRADEKLTRRRGGAEREVIVTSRRGPSESTATNPFSFLKDSLRLRASAPPREILCILAAIVVPAVVFADDPRLPAPVSILIADDQPASPSDLHAAGAAENVGPSPYADWSGQGQPLTTSREDQLAEIHPAQADWINAAFAQLDYRSDAHCRAGWPECIRSRAIPSDTGRYCGYYVGGGAVLHYEGRYLDEGTWGWDYMGLCFRKRVALDWWHGRYQGGTGQYQTDGPKLRHE